jgi:hypothetical protein
MMKSPDSGNRRSCWPTDWISTLQKGFSQRIKLFVKFTVLLRPSKLKYICILGYISITNEKEIDEEINLLADSLITTRRLYTLIITAHH